MLGDALRLLRDRGWDVVIEQGDGFTWATLVAVENPDFVVHRYGRGVDAASAVARAWHRFETEQIGGPPED